MPTELPIRRIAPPEPSGAGNLVFAVAVLLMLVISAAMLLHPEDIAAAPAAPTSGQAL